jgi:hypothetical protein
MNGPNIDVHNFKRRLELAFDGVRSGAFPEKNKTAILDFCSHCSREDLGIKRVEHHACTLKKIAEPCKKEFKNLAKEDVYQLACHAEPCRLQRIDPKKPQPILIL